MLLVLRLLRLLALLLLLILADSKATDTGAGKTAGITERPEDCDAVLSTLGGGDVGTDCRGTCNGNEADLGSGGGVVLRGALLGAALCADRSVPLDFGGESCVLVDMLRKLNEGDVAGENGRSAEQRSEFSLSAVKQKCSAHSRIHPDYPGPSCPECPNCNVPHPSRLPGHPATMAESFPHATTFQKHL